MKTRIISAAVGLVLLAAVLMFYETILLDLAVAFLSGVAVYEMIKTVGLHKEKTFALVCVAFAVLFSSEFYQRLSSLSGFVEFGLGIIILIFVLRNHKEVRATEAAFVFFFTLFIPKAFSIVILFRSYEEAVFYFLILTSFAVAWLNDTCAYFSGRFFGKRKLCPEISPKKTVEGAIGGVFGEVILSAVLAFIYASATGYTINWVGFVLFLPVGAVLAILGDLSASIIKRQFGIKDYGNIMPGHGGVMDRFDSWIFVAPVLYLWNIYIPLIG